MKAKKQLGQNFLQDTTVLKDIITAGELLPKDTVVEVGPGKGILTQALLKEAEKIIAIELDRELITQLKNKLAHNKNLILIHGDALQFNPPKSAYKVIANIPYYITSPLLKHFLYEQFLNGNPPMLMVLMLQHEVAEKILAKDGKQSILSLQVQLFGEPKLIRLVPKEAFWPIPKVDSAVMQIRVEKKPKITGDLKKLFWLFHISFAHKRKKLTNNLSVALKKDPQEIRSLLKSIKISPDIRAEALTLKEWQRLFTRIHSSKSPAL